MTAIWILGWTGISIVAGSFFDLPLRTIALVGATLGPLGFIVTLAIGILESRGAGGQFQIEGFQTSKTHIADIDDPFA